MTKPKAVTQEYIRPHRIWDAEIAPLGIPSKLWRESVLRDELEQDRAYFRRRGLPFPSDKDA